MASGRARQRYRSTNLALGEWLGSRSASDQATTSLGAMPRIAFRDFQLHHHPKTFSISRLNGCPVGSSYRPLQSEMQQRPSGGGREYAVRLAFQSGHSQIRGFGERQLSGARSNSTGHNRTLAYSEQRTFKRLLHSKSCRTANSCSS